MPIRLVSGSVASPGRVAVDSNGDVWIVNRAFGHQGTLTKFSGDLSHCIDRNNNGVIDTSFDKNGDVPLRPTSTAEAMWRSRRFPLEDYEFTG